MSDTTLIHVCSKQINIIPHQSLVGTSQFILNNFLIHTYCYNYRTIK